MGNAKIDKKYGAGYKIADSILQRVNNKKSTSYAYYGKQGVKSGFKDTASLAEYIRKNLGPRPKNATVERIDQAKGYVAGNLKWASKKEQANSRRARGMALRRTKSKGKE